MSLYSLTDLVNYFSPLLSINGSRFVLNHVKSVFFSLVCACDCECASVTCRALKSPPSGIRALGLNPTVFVTLGRSYCISLSCCGASENYQLEVIMQTIPSVMLLRS